MSIDVRAHVKNAGELLASVLGDGMTASHIGPHLCCTEVDNVAIALALLDHRHAALTLLEGHTASSEEGEDDEHHGLKRDERQEADAAKVNSYLDELLEGFGVERTPVSLVKG